ncbi:hypothetical protein BJ508DRAFT_412303 [Ascobolus immersus RN42]|uniref:Uncharacterized protein n=1 Tax=Ascobolus immersus RN42 TaxID=1160509 RepID=A0A3N4IM37_ASCIM|nr:hypothetical protein BJ508DRAFT_412303 [Ascobolus immersus RN42]
MSLRSAPILAARAPAPFFSIPIHHIKRQNDLDTNDMPEIICEGESVFTTEYEEGEERMACPNVEKLVVDCTLGGRTYDEWTATNDENLRFFQEKKHCVKLCNSFIDESFYTMSLECLATGCKDSKKNEAANKKYFEQLYTDMYEEVCAGFGLTEASKGSDSGSDKTVIDKAKADDKTGSDDADDSEESAGGASEETDKDSAEKSGEAAKKEDDGSAASGMRMGGKWGTSVVLAVVLGSVFSGLLI